MEKNTTSELIMSQREYNRIRRYAQESAVLSLNWEERKELNDIVERTRLRRKITVLFVFVEGVLSCAHTDDGKTWVIKKNQAGRIVFCLPNGQEYLPMQWSVEYEKDELVSERNNNVYVSKREVYTKP